MSKFDTVIVSDVHLGSKISRAKELLAELRKIRKKHGFRRLILLGDIFDDSKFFTDPTFSKFPKSHRRLLKYWRALANSGKVELIWVEGNHDRGIINLVSPFVIGQRVMEFSWECNGEKFIATHGDKFDKFVANESLSSRATQLYVFLQGLDLEDPKFSRWLERKVTWRIRKHLSAVMPGLAVEHARRFGAENIICGHSHIPVQRRVIDNVNYYNTGSFVEHPATYITVGKEGVVLHEVK